MVGMHDGCNDGLNDIYMIKMIRDSNQWKIQPVCGVKDVNGNFTKISAYFYPKGSGLRSSCSLYKRTKFQRFFTEDVA